MILPLCRIDLERHEIYVRGRSVPVTPKEFTVMSELVKADGRVLTRADLLEKIWGYDRALNIDTRVVDQHIARLRRALGPEGSKAIMTVVNSGYRASRVEVAQDTEMVGRIRNIKRAFGKKSSATLTLTFDGVLPEIKVGDTLRLSA